jgi:hypothetical protein
MQSSNFSAEYSASEASRQTALERYQIIEPILKARRLRFSDGCRNRGIGRVKTIDWLTNRHGVSRRTIYRWLSEWNRAGLPGLLLKIRRDKGHPNGARTK